MAVAFAGCLVDLPQDISLDIEVMSDDSHPNPLLVPEVRAGEKARTDTVGEGFQLVTDDEDELRVEPYEISQSVQRVVRIVPDAHDAWLRTTPGVSVSHLLRFMEEDTEQHSHFSTSSMYELATGLALYDEASTVTAHEVWACSGPSCGRGSSSGPETSRQYSRDRMGFGFADLAGRALDVGQTYRMEKTLSVHRSDVRLVVEYEVLREELLDGERTMVVKSSESVEPVDEFDHGDPEPASEDDVPEPVQLLWYSERASVPVRAERTWWFSHGDELYKSTATSTLVKYEAGSETIPWGEGTPLEPLTTVAEERGLPPLEFFRQPSPGAGYPLASAWGSIQGDMTLTRYQSFQRNNPGSLPLSSVYLPEQDEGKRTWVFQMRDMRGSGVDVGAREWYPIAAPVALHENREIGMGPTWVEPTHDRDLAHVRLLRFGEGYGMYRAAGGTQSEPAVWIALGPSWASWEDTKATITFAKPEVLMSQDYLYADIDLVFLDDSVTIDLLDGGLRSVNGLWQFWALVWNRIPYGLSMGLDAGDVGVEVGGLPSLAGLRPPH